ncbi:hypothetical protein PSHT_13296 [Puccinia striiformis]|uniref:Uncharacterized protein n=1 Tax=Puccinia striiformis TaxID=27350 RepID=A0A2S4URP0_9BASI|nr:hypothetical protein PSHT_13296 [Puccinia striiformis]
MDSSISFQARTISSSTASLINQEDPEDDSISDPLQQWLLFDPPPIHEEAEEEDEGEGEFQSISHPILHTSMPSHDGTGHFLSPNGSEHGGPSDHPQNITIQSLKSLSEYGEGSSIDDDLLSIPSSLSITRSISSRSVSDFRPQEMDMDHDEAELLITPMAISAGLLHQHQSQSQSQSHSGSGSHRSRDQLRTKRTTSRHSNRTHSRSSRPRSSSSRVLDSPNTSSSSLQKPSVLFINPTSDKQNINHSTTGIHSDCFPFFIFFSSTYESSPTQHLRMSSQLNLPDSAAEDEDEDDSNPFNSISRSSSSLASGLLKKVLDEWTNW